MKLLSPKEPCWRTWRGAHLPGTLMDRSRGKLWRQVSLSVGAHWGTRGVQWLGILERVGGLQIGSISLCGSSVRGGSFLEIRKDMWRRAQGTDITHQYHWGSIHRELWELVERGLWKRGIPLYGSSFRGTWREGSFARWPEGYERKALSMGIFPHGGSVGQPGVGSSTGDLEIWLKGALGVECLSLWELCEGNLEGGLPCWGPWRICRRLWKWASLSIGAPFGEPGGGLIYRGLLRNGWRGLCGGGLGGGGGVAPSPGTLEDMLRKSLDMGISLHGGPFPSEGNLVCGGGASYTRDFHRWMNKSSSGAASLHKGFYEGDLEGGLLYSRTRKTRFLKDMQNAL